jgi:uncharacterized membrane protein (UPF0127 family)
MNDRTRSAVALEVDVAATRATRRRGLLGRESLGATEGLLLTPCKAVHTVGMRFPIDVIFIDRDDAPFASCRRSRRGGLRCPCGRRQSSSSPRGRLPRRDIQIGDMLYLAPAPPPRKRSEA